ncbi:uncharacterized protein LOC108210416 [Daucus carota subsp. sativus]|uniref:uncharacterized protein LOC108210416 n=1 Tax=Daucus carota subsp. sativus TaxID=79200 RepID=UPI0007EFA462|nr:PREDICTED: uncharacterized protein DDB_G0283697 [Daucus carota subsp. sativus]
MANEETIESQIEVAMASRIPHFRQQADTLTFEGVRRLLEKDLGLDKFALDVHKRFVKQLLSKYLEGDDDDITKNSEKTVDKNVCTDGDVAVSSDNNLADKDVKEPNTKEEGKMEESPIMGLLTESKSPETRVEEIEDTKKNEYPSEITVKEAMSKRAAYFKANSENITMAGVRRLLEKDLKLEECTLDPLKKFIREEIDKVFASNSSTLSTGNKKKSAPRKTLKNVSSGGSSNSTDSGSEDMEEVKPRKKIVRKEKVPTSKMSNKRKRPAEAKASAKKQNKLAKLTSEEVSGDDGGNDSEDDQSHSSEEKPVKKKEVSAPAAYGKDVERLKSIIKACGMSVPPVIYKKAKQVPDDEREDFIVKELEKILEKEGLSRKPDEKEIKEVRKRKERAKELEGIDMSNIVQSSRRRSTMSFIPPPKPQIPVESDAEESENSDDGTDDDNSDEDKSDGDVDDIDMDEQNDSQTDEPHEDNEDSD